MIELIILGDPVAQGRPRFNSYTKKAHDPIKSKNYKLFVGHEAKLQHQGPLIDCPIRVEIDVYRKNNKGTSKKEIARREKKLSMPTVKPDIDNYVKGIKDALNGVIWVDDNLVIELEAKKYYSVNPRIEVRIKELKS
ncbi:RusA family crossover junction endodeoxyribonuclease [Dellaglioa algida]|uniref:RusA family crossover junction endodeoxyribonuclease n=1 Tax=Dellaglioa algida TaxID=105612 RepID=UPI0024C48B91|nr:RusA family crossover junction endodeoxyribonuclease [Dellaglioa algida]MDK1716610.1 RusA family crossover junction endodeoxyribonuclease [Dellaglioa algida]MDK1721552.1 RusA family crossover junction endodeoxyribonuclease [Dellaglioa algida]